MESIFASIKSTRKLSMSNWRYRILHWTFAVEAGGPAESPLPKFLYTHYCPLFHLTNILLLALPLTVVAKVVWRVCSAFAAAVIWAKRKWEDHQRAERAKNPQKHAAKKLIFDFKMCLKEKRSFDVFWEIYGAPSGADRDEWKLRWDEYQDGQAERDAAAAAKTAKRRERIIFWTHISSVAFRGVFYVGCATLVVLALYFTLFWLIPGSIEAAILGWKYLVSAAQADWLALVFSVLKGLLIVSGGMAGLTGVAYLLQRHGKGDFGTPIRSVWRGAVYPVKAASTGALHTAAGWADGIAEFVSMFYAENCPPIEIVSELDEQLADE